MNNQYLYDDGETAKILENDYAGWVLEPKGSDYVSIRVNEISLQKDGTTPVNVYVINQNKLIDTITIAPDNGRLAFRETDITFGNPV